MTDEVCINQPYLVNILQYIRISHHHFRHLKLTQYYVSSILIKLEKKCIVTSAQIHQLISLRHAPLVRKFSDGRNHIYFVHLYIPSAYKLFDNQYAHNKYLFNKCCHWDLEAKICASPTNSGELLPTIWLYKWAACYQVSEQNWVILTQTGCDYIIFNCSSLILLKLHYKRNIIIIYL